MLKSKKNVNSYNIWHIYKKKYNIDIFFILNSKLMNKKQELNNKFKSELPIWYTEKWNKLCKNYTLDLIMNLFIWWINSKERYWRNNDFITQGIILRIKENRNINWMDKKYYYSIKPLFEQFYDFYKNNTEIIKLVNNISYNDKYEKVFNWENTKKFDSKKIKEWIDFLKKDNIKNSDIYYNNLKYIFRIFNENDIINMFIYFLKWSSRIHELNNTENIKLWWENPFNITKNELNDNIQRNINHVSSENIKIIDSLFSIYLNYLKTRKKIKDVISHDNEKSKNTQNMIKWDISDILDFDEDDKYNEDDIIYSERWVVNADYYKNWDIKAPNKNFLLNDSQEDIFPNNIDRDY